MGCVGFLNLFFVWVFFVVLVLVDLILVFAYNKSHNYYSKQKNL